MMTWEADMPLPGGLSGVQYTELLPLPGGLTLFNGNCENDNSIGLKIMGKAKYPWDDWFDGNERIVDCSSLEVGAIGLQKQIVNAAIARGKAISTERIEIDGRECVKIIPRSNLPALIPSEIIQGDSNVALVERQQILIKQSPQLLAVQSILSNLEEDMENGKIITFERPYHFKGSSAKFAEQVVDFMFSRGVERESEDYRQYELDFSNSSILKVYLGYSAVDYRNRNNIMNVNLVTRKKLADRVPVTKDKINEWFYILKRDKELVLERGRDYTCSNWQMIGVIAEEAELAGINIGTIFPTRREAQRQDAYRNEMIGDSHPNPKVKTEQKHEGIKITLRDGFGELLEQEYELEEQLQLSDESYVAPQIEAKKEVLQIEENGQNCFISELDKMKAMVKNARRKEKETY